MERYTASHMWSSFHIHQPGYEAIRFYAVAPGSRQVIVAHTDGQKLVYKNLPEALTIDLVQDKEIKTNLATVIGDYPHEACDGCCEQRDERR